MPLEENAYQFQSSVSPPPAPGTSLSDLVHLADLSSLNLDPYNTTPPWAIPNMNTLELLAMVLKNKVVLPDLTYINPYATYSSSSTGTSDYTIGPVVIKNRSLKFRSIAGNDWGDLVFVTGLHTGNCKEKDSETWSYITDDIEEFLREYKLDINLEDLEVQTSKSFAWSIAKVLSEKPLSQIQTENDLEKYIMGQMMEIIEPLVKITLLKFNKNNITANGELCKETVIAHYLTLMQKISGAPLIDVKIEDFAENKSKHKNLSRFHTEYSLSSQQTLKALSLNARADILSSISLRETIHSIHFPFDTLYTIKTPLIITAIIEIKKSAVLGGFSELKEQLQLLESLQNFTQPSSAYETIQPNIKFLFKNEGLSRIFNKIVQQCVRTCCPKFILIDRNSVVFCHLSTKLDKQGCIPIKVFGPFGLFSTEKLRLMIASFLSYSQSLEDEMREKQEMLEVSRNVRLWSISQEQLFDPKAGPKPAFQTREQSNICQRGSDLSKDTERSYAEQEQGHSKDAAHQMKPATWSANSASSEGSVYKSDSSIPKSAETSATLSSIAESEPESLLGYTYVPHPKFKLDDRPARFTRSPDLVEDLFDVYELDMMKMDKFLVHQHQGSLSLTLIVHPSIIKIFPAELLDPGLEDKYASFASSDASPSLENWLVLKMMCPSFWNDETIREVCTAEEKKSQKEGHSTRQEPLNLMQVCSNKVIEEVKKLVLVNDEHISPKVIGYGIIDDISKEINKDFSIISPIFTGPFILMEFCGWSVYRHGGAESLDRSMKEKIIFKLEKLHNHNILHRDLHEDNITLTKLVSDQSDSWEPWIIDLGNSIFCDDERTKRDEMETLKSRLHFQYP